MKTVALSLVLSALSNFSFANVITVEFDVTVNSKINTSYQPVPFTPLEHQTILMTFDTSLSRVDRYWDTSLYPINTHATSYFGTSGSTSISSPVDFLTGTNPIPNAPVGITTRMTSQMSYSLLPTSMGEPQVVSYAHSLGGSMNYSSSYSPGGPTSYAGESWYRTVSIFSPSEYVGLLSEYDIRTYTYGSVDLIAELLSMQKAGTAFSFVDQFSYENRPTLLTSGYSYRGSAVITNISGFTTAEVPEPTSWLLFGLGGILYCYVHNYKRPIWRTTAEAEQRIGVSAQEGSRASRVRGSGLTNIHKSALDTIGVTNSSL